MAKPTKEQKKAALTKIVHHLMNQRKADENTVSNTEDIQKVEKQNETPSFDNEQMLLHFYDMTKAVKLKFAKELISVDQLCCLPFNSIGI